MDRSPAAGTLACAESEGLRATSRCVRFAPVRFDSVTASGERETLARATDIASIVGWVSALIAPAVVFLVTTSALLQRRNDYCPIGATEISGQWEFSLIPLGQTCSQQMSTEGSVAQWIAALIVSAAALLMVSACVVVSVAWKAGSVPGYARWLLYAVATGGVLALVVWLRMSSVDSYIDRAGVSLGIVWSCTLAFGAGLATTALVGFVRYLYREGREGLVA